MSGVRGVGALVMACALGLAGAPACAPAVTPTAAPQAAATALPKPEVAGHLADARLREASGIAASRRHAGRYWLHNDSGDGALLYAIDGQGAAVGTLQVDGVIAVDWEDIASFEQDGTPYLLVADSGDNFGMRGEYTLIAIEEPELPADAAPVHVQPAWRQRYRYADAPHDTEAMAVDAVSGNVLLLPKFVEPLTLFRVPLHAGAGVQVAQRWATLAEPGSAAPGAGGAGAKSGTTSSPKFRPTALDVDARHAVVLGYRSAWLYARDDGEGWPAAFARAPRRIGVVPPLHQPEAAGFSVDGNALLITGEGRDQPLLRLALPH